MNYSAVRSTVLLHSYNIFIYTIRIKLNLGSLNNIMNRTNFSSP